MSEETAFLSAADLTRRYADATLSPSEVIEDVLARIARFDATLNAFQLVDAEAARGQAASSTARWQDGKPLSDLDGVPISIKELVLTKGWPTPQGSRATNPDQTWNEDAPAVARLREAGAVLFGKTTSPEFGWKGITDSPLNGTTRSPWNPEHTPGGSSGGASAAVAAGIGPLALGTDGGGSVRIPSGYTGLYGIKPTFGRVPSIPVESPFCTLVSSGPLARNVADAARMLNTITKPDARDWYAAAYDGVDYLEGLDLGVQGLRIAYCPDLGGAQPDAAVTALTDHAVRLLEDLGAHVEQPGSVFEPLRPIFEDYWVAGFGHILRGIAEDKRDLLDPGFRALAERGLGVDVETYYKGLGARAMLGARMAAFHETYDVLVTPTLPTTAPRADVMYHSAAFDRWDHAVPYTVPFNLTGQPAASVPVGLATDGLPVGLQIVATRFADRLVLRVSAALESAIGFAQPHADLQTALDNMG